MITRRRFHLYSLFLLTTLWLVGCSVTGSAARDSNAQFAAALAPTGVLRIGVYQGSPTSMVVDAKTGARHGVAFQLGQELSKQLGVPFDIVEFPRVAEILSAMKTADSTVATVDFTFTNATEIRAKDVNFTQPLVGLELGYLVPQNSAIHQVADVDKVNGINPIRVGVAAGSSSQGKLVKIFKNAVIVTVPSLKVAVEQLKTGQLNAFATNKGILFELKDSLPAGQFRVLDDRWGVENLAIAIPKGRELAMPFLNTFAEQAISNGLIERIASQSGLRGLAEHGVEGKE